MINPFYSKTGGMQAEKCEQVKMVLTIVCGIYLIIVESLKGLKSEITIEKRACCGTLYKLYWAHFSERSSIWEKI